MADYEKLRPEITPLHEPFWDSVKRHQVELQRCDSCGAFRFIPTELCRCGSAASTWTPIAGTGEVYTYTVVHRAPTPAYQAEAPYVIAHVTVDEGPRMISVVVGCDPTDVHIGMPVTLVYEDVAPDLTLYKFTPAG
ncbi:MAG: OB-fold domain-containing protein [Acidobacteria bacterium]|nr:OB-fold domain-containing protein [Acidobacteriota bacterium]